MTSTPAPPKDHGRAGRNLPAAIGSAVVLLAAIGASLAFWKTAFLIIVAAAVVVAIWELRQGMLARDIDLPEQLSERRSQELPDSSGWQAPLPARTPGL